MSVSVIELTEYPSMKHIYIYFYIYVYAVYIYFKNT